MDRFYFSNGDSAGSLEELLDKIKIINDECFNHHVNEEKNDFASWIRGSLEDETLAKKIEKKKSRGDVISIIDKKVNTPAKIKRGIINQIKEAILHE